MPDVAFVNGDYVPLVEARIPLMDRNVAYGDAAYEVVRSLGATPLFLDRHRDRLGRTLAVLEIDPPAAPLVAEVCRELIRRGGYEESVIVIHVTRGVGPRSRAHQPDAPSIYAWITECPTPDPALARDGVALITVPDERWSRRDLKTVMSIPGVLATRRARAAGVFDALLVEPDGTVNEAAAANIAAVVDDCIITPPATPRILAGITRDVILEIARAGKRVAGKRVAGKRVAGKRIVEERPLPLAELLGADETFLMGTTADVVPVVEIDRVRIGPGVPGPVTAELARAYRALCLRPLPDDA